MKRAISGLMIKRESFHAIDKAYQPNPKKSSPEERSFRILSRHATIVIILYVALLRKKAKSALHGTRSVFSTTRSLSIIRWTISNKRGGEGTRGEHAH